MKIALVDESTLVTAEETNVMLLACEKQMLDVSAGWERQPPTIALYDNEKDVPADWVLVVLLDDSDQAGDLGYHSETPSGRVYARVFARPSIDNGSTALTGQYSVCSVLSHEIIELYVDPFINVWVDGPAGSLGSCYAYEACDPVEGDSYPVPVTYDGKSYSPTVSNWVLPSWFDDAAHGHVDFMGTAPGPFMLAPGGYMVVREAPGSEQQVFGSIPPPAWRMEAKKHEAARTTRRLGTRA